MKAFLYRNADIIGSGICGAIFAIVLINQLCK